MGLYSSETDAILSVVRVRFQPCGHSAPNFNLRSPLARIVTLRRFSAALPASAAGPISMISNQPLSRRHTKTAARAQRLFSAMPALWFVLVIFACALPLRPGHAEVVIN